MSPKRENRDLTPLYDAHAPRDGFEPGVVFERVEARVDLDRDQIERPIFQRLVQPAEAEIDVAERELNPGEFQRRHVALSRVGLQLLEHFNRLFAASGEREGAAEGAVHARRLRRQVNGALESRRRLVEVLALFLDHAEDPVGWREMRVELDGVVALLERGLEVAAIEMDHREIAGDDRRDRIE